MSTKDSGMRVRIERDLREAFVNACQAQGLGASEVLRDFMRSFAAKHSSEQAILFGQASKRTAAGAGKRGPR
jgi:antitoxin component of RelBE/YafQ-DinJ toxin-antitoxin module